MVKEKIPGPQSWGEEVGFENGSAFGGGMGRSISRNEHRDI